MNRAMPEHHSQREFSDGHGIGAGSVHDRDALAGGGFEIDVIDAHARPANHAQLGRMLQQSAVDLHGGTHNQRVGGFEVRRQLAFNLIGSDQRPARLLQQGHGRG